MTDWLVAPSGNTVAFKTPLVSTPRVKDMVVRSSSTPVAEISAGFVMVTLQTAVWPPSSVVTVISVSPSPTGVTIPPDTVATASLEEVHVTDWLVAFSGNTAAFNVPLVSMPRVKDMVVWSSSMQVTGTVSPVSSAKTGVIID